jgi:hypothetical protein
VAWPEGLTLTHCQVWGGAMPPAIAWFAGVGVACGGRCRTDEPVLDGGAWRAAELRVVKPWGAVPTEHPPTAPRARQRGSRSDRVVPGRNECRMWRGEPPSHGSDETAHPRDLRPYTCADPVSDDQGLQTDMFSSPTNQTMRILRDHRAGDGRVTDRWWPSRRRFDDNVARDLWGLPGLDRSLWWLM